TLYRFPPLRPPQVETVHGLDHGRSHPQTPPRRSRHLGDSNHHARSLTTVFGTESRRRSVFQCGRSSSLGFTRDLSLGRPGRPIDKQPGRDVIHTPPPGNRFPTDLGPAQVQAILDVLDLRERLIVRLALFSGMRPREILALQWKHVADDHVAVVHRLYRGKLDRPKSERSKRKVALSLGIAV